MRVPSGIVSWSVSTAKDGMAMITRMMTGSAVQTHLDQGVVGEALRGRVGPGIEAHDDDDSSSTSTSSESPMAIQTSRPSWKAWIESMIGVTEPWKPISPGTGLTGTGQGQAGRQRRGRAQRDPERAEN